jgi:hypothetical protein
MDNKKDYICGNCGKEYEVDLCFCNECISPKVVSKKSLSIIMGVPIKYLGSLFTSPVVKNEKDNNCDNCAIDKE